MITVTEAAAERIRAALAESEDSELALRAAARRAADGSIEYAIGLDERRERDTEVACGDLTVLVSPPSLALVDGLVIDFGEVEPGQSAFLFYRAADLPAAPPAAGACGCGSGGCG
jgi:Fe-S cluster assembly iron-binding protein IscA